MSWLAGIDVDTKAIHVVAIDENDLMPPTYNRWDLNGHDAWERVRNVREAMRGMDWSDCLAIGLESPAGRAGTGLYAVIRTTGAVLACLPDQVLVQPWRPGEWRKAVGLPGNCSKAHVMEQANALLWRVANRGPDYMNIYAQWPQDACDAYCIALATRLAVETSRTA